MHIKIARRHSDSPEVYRHTRTWRNLHKRWGQPEREIFIIQKYLLQLSYYVNRNNSKLSWKCLSFHPSIHLEGLGVCVWVCVHVSRQNYDTLHTVHGSDRILLRYYIRKCGFSRLTLRSGTWAYNLIFAGKFWQFYTLVERRQS